MEKYIVNNVEIEYDTFDLEAMELRQRELEEVGRICEETKGDGDAYQKIRRFCNAMLDFFDAVVGPGTAEKVCGQRVNMKTINDAYRDFNAQVDRRLAEYRPWATAVKPGTVTPMNREQRRAAMRE